MILTQSQAKAVADAMCALNNVGGYLRAAMNGVIVQQRTGGEVVVTRYVGEGESYATQGHFFAAYKLD